MELALLILHICVVYLTLPTECTSYNAVDAKCAITTSAKKLIAQTKIECALLCKLDVNCKSVSFNNELWVLPDSQRFTSSNAGSILGKSRLINVLPNIGNEVWVDDRRFWVFQQRKTGAVSFARNWTEYERGFGDSDDFWGGLLALSRITASPNNLSMRAEILDFDGSIYVAEYQGFTVQNASTNYKMTFAAFDRTRTNFSATYDTLDPCNGMPFSTYEVDNDGLAGGSCSTLYHGSAGWWFRDCTNANPNGVFSATMLPGTSQGIMWFYIHYNYNSFKGIRLMIELKD